MHTKHLNAYEMHTNLIFTIRYTVTVTIAQKVENGEFLLGGCLTVKN